MVLAFNLLPKNFNEPMGAPAIFGKQIGIKLLHPASTEGVTDSGLSWPIDHDERHPIQLIREVKASANGA
jgi:hypothetical protein